MDQTPLQSNVLLITLVSLLKLQRMMVVEKRKVVDTLHVEEVIQIKEVILYVGQKVLRLICHSLQKILHVDVKEKKKRMMVNRVKDNPLAQLK